MGKSVLLLTFAVPHLWHNITLPVTILHKTKNIAGMGKDANLEGCYYNSALATHFKPKDWWRPILLHHSHRKRFVYRHDGKIDNNP